VAQNDAIFLQIFTLNSTCFSQKTYRTC